MERNSSKDPWRYVPVNKQSPSIFNQGKAEYSEESSNKLNQENEIRDGVTKSSNENEQNEELSAEQIEELKKALP